MSAYLWPTAPGASIVSALARLLRRPGPSAGEATESPRPGKESGPDGEETGNPMERLVREVEHRVGYPVDRWAVAVALEAGGWRDVDASRYGCDDLFALADRVYPLCRKARVEAGRPIHREHPVRSGARRAWRVVHGLVEGVGISLPILGQVAAVLTLGYSLWAWMRFTETEATVVALGTIGSFVATGGFVQCIGREGHRYLGMKAPHLARRSYARLRTLGLATVLVLAAAALLLDALFPFYPLPLMSVSLVYFVLLSCLWLVLSILYVLKRHLAIAAFTLGGVIPVFGVMELTDWGIYAAHAVGLVTTIGMSAVYGKLLLEREIRKHDARSGRKETWLPPVAVEFHDLLPYFLYGLSLFAFLFVDRIIAWSVTGSDPSPYVIWFRTPYELGLDWALIPLLAVFAVLHHTSTEFSDWTSPSHKRRSALSVVTAVGRFRTLYHRHFAVLLVTGAASVAAVFLAVVRVEEAGWMPALTTVVTDPVTNRVYWWAAGSYVLAAIGLYNVLLFFALERPWLAVKSIALGLAANVLAGLSASRLIGFEYAAAGLLVGSVVFLAVSSRYVRQVLTTFAYCRYSAL